MSKATLIALSLTGLVASSASADVITLYASEDTHITEQSADSNFATSASAQLISEQYATNSARGLFRFDLTSIPVGSTINSATFGVYATAGDGSRYWQVYEVLTDWVADEVTWNEASGGVSWATPGGDVPAVDSFLASDDVASSEIPGYNPWPSPTSANFATESAAIRNLVQQWLDEPASNYGLMLKKDYGLGTLTVQMSEGGDNDPRLVVDYTVPEPASAAMLGVAVAGLLASRNRRD